MLKRCILTAWKIKTIRGEDWSSQGKKDQGWTWKQPKWLLVIQWWYIHTMEYNLEIKKEWCIAKYTTWMNLKIIILSERSQNPTSPKIWSTYCMIPILEENQWLPSREGVMKGAGWWKGRKEGFQGTQDTWALWICYFDCCDGFRGMYMSKLIKLYMLNMCSLYINYTAIKLFIFLNEEVTHRLLLLER